MSSIYVGRRKSAVALVRFVKGNGDFVINEKSGFSYLQQDPFAIQTVVAPLKLVNLEKKYDIICLVRGGGISAQAEAIQLGIARAICSLDSNSQNLYSPSISKGISQGDKEEEIFQRNTSMLPSSLPLATDSKAKMGNGKESETKKENESMSVASLPNNSLLKKRSLLKEQGYLRRDSRIKERRKYGLKKARKAEQYSKR